MYNFRDIVIVTDEEFKKEYMKKELKLTFKIVSVYDNGAYLISSSTTRACYVVYDYQIKLHKDFKGIFNELEVTNEI